MADVTKLIEKDHRAVEKLFAEFEKTGRRSVADQICEELDRHAAGEEKVVYPVVADEVAGTKKLVEEGEHEHKEARQLIGRIRRTSREEHLAKLVEELKQAVEHHVEEEESEILPKVRNAFSRGRLDELAQQFEDAKG